MKSPRTIHDFHGFPEELFKVQYPAPGAPGLAKRILELIGTDEGKADESWGLDHGAWSVLRRVYPEADIPVLQLSLDRNKSPHEHGAMAKQLLPLLYALALRTSEDPVSFFVDQVVLGSISMQSLRIG